MPFDPYFDNKTKFLVLYLDGQIKATRISKLLQVPVRTIQDWIQKTDSNKDIRKIEEGRGRKTTSDPNLEENILRRIRVAPQKSSTRKLGARYQTSKSNVHDILKKRHRVYQSTTPTYELDEEQKQDRIDYCQEMLEENGDMIDQVFFTDEMGIKLSETTTKMAWGLPGKKIKVTKPTKDCKVSCWGGISARGATSLHIYKDTLNASRYEDILEEHIPEMQALYPEGFLFQQDNLPAHRAIDDWIESQNLEQVTFPSYSPDLSPIENIWFSLKDSVRQDAPRNEAELIRSLQNNWQALTTPANLEPYFNTLVHRYDECVQMEGERLPY